MKKIISLILLMSMLISLGIGAGAENSAEILTDTSDAVEFLTKIGVLEIADSSMTAMLITREDFAVYTANLLGLDVNTVSTVRYFSDVNMSSYGAYAIEKLVEMGIISTADDGKFRPADKITQAEAAKILCAATGYGEYAEANGGFPSGYIKTANRNRILVPVADARSMTITEAAEMIYRAAQLGMYTQTTFGSDSDEYSVSSDDTLLSIYHDIYFAEGLITSAAGRCLDGNADLKPDTMYVGGTEYIADAEIQSPDRLGDYVKFFYVQKSKDVLGEIVYITNETELKTIKISSKDFVNYDGTNAEYYSERSDRKTQKTQISNPVVVYNGYPVKTDVIKTVNSVEKGYITIKDMNADGRYDMIIIDDYITYVVSEKDSAKQTIYNKLSDGGYIDLSEYTNVRFFDVSGNQTDLTAVKAGNALSVAKSRGGEHISIYISSNAANGVIEKMNDDADEPYITVAGSNLSVDKSYFKEFRQIAYVGGMFYYTLDMFDDIVYASADSKNAMSFGYILASTLSGEVFTSTAKIKLMNEKAETEEAELAEAVKIDGVRYKENDKAYKALFKLNNGTPKELAIRYIKDENGKITDVDTPYLDTKYETELNSITPIYDEDFGTYFGEANRLGLKCYVNGNTKVFNIPKNKNPEEIEADDISVGSGSDVANQGNYTANAYTSSKLNEYHDFVIKKYDPSGLTNNKFSPPVFVVSALSKELNAEGDVCDKISGYLNGTFKEYILDTDINIGDVSEGDVVRFNYNIKEQPTKAFSDGQPDIIILYDYSKLKGEKPTKADGWNGIDETGESGRCYYSVGTETDGYRANFQLSFGYVHRKIGSTIEFGYKSGSDFDEIFRSTAGKVIVIDDSMKAGERVYSGSASDILDYKTVGAECSTVIAQTSYWRQIALIVYK